MVMTKCREASGFLKPLSTACGIEVHGINIAKELCNDNFLLMRQAIVEHKVLVLRGQQSVNPQQLRDFSKLWGELSVNGFSLVNRPVAPNAPFADDISGRCDMQIFENHAGAPVGRGNVWHSDVSYKIIPPRFTILHAQIVPKIGGDTLFMDMAKALHYLPRAICNSIRNKRALHSGDAFLKRLEKQLIVEPILSDHNKTWHPLICQHPDSKQAMLFYNMDLVKAIDSCTAEESQYIIDTINLTLCSNTEIVYRHRWQVGDILVWDNRALMHFATYDYEKNSRLMYRTMIDADSAPEAMYR